MEVFARPLDEVAVECIVGRDPFGVFSLHDGHQLGSDLVNLITCEQAANLAGREHVIDVLEESLVLDFVVRQKESNPGALDPRNLVQLFDVEQKIRGIVRPSECDLK